MTNIFDKSIYVLRREYGKLNFGDYFYIKWINNNFVFCNAEGTSLYNEDHYVWENQVFILSSKLLDRPVVLLGGAKFLTTNNKLAGLGIGFGAASAKHYGYDNKSYAVYCYNLPTSENISKLFLVQKNGKLIYTTNDENSLWKTIEDIYKTDDETIFKITLTKMGWNISSIKTNSLVDIQTQYITHNQKIDRSLKNEMNLNQGNNLTERVTTLNNLNEIDILTAVPEISIEVVEISANYIEIPIMSKYEIRRDLINKCIEHTNIKNIVFKKQTKEQSEQIINYRKIVVNNN